MSKAERILDFKPVINLDDGLKAFCDWAVGQDKDNSGYEKPLAEMEKAGMFVRKN